MVKRMCTWVAASTSGQHNLAVATPVLSLSTSNTKSTHTSARRGRGWRSRRFYSYHCTGALFLYCYETHDCHFPACCLYNLYNLYNMCRIVFYNNTEHKPRTAANIHRNIRKSSCSTKPFVAFAHTTPYRPYLRRYDTWFSQGNSL